MPKKKLPYKEGDWFAVPLQDGGYALGLAARVSRGGAILGYFFGPRHETVPTVEDTQGLTSKDAIYIGVFGDLGLLYGEWSIVHRPDAWQRDPWPMPEFGRVDSIDATIAFRTAYNENRLTEAIRETRVSPEEARSLPKDSSLGSEGVALHLGRLLS